jgi:hypothetical protein
MNLPLLIIILSQPLPFFTLTVERVMMTTDRWSSSLLMGTIMRYARKL